MRGWKEKEEKKYKNKNEGCGNTFDHEADGFKKSRSPLLFCAKMYYYMITDVIEGIKIIKINKFEDERGWLAEIFRNDEIEYNPVMGYISLTRPGVIRGPHEHKEQSDFFIFLGPGDFELHLWDARDNSSTKGGYLKIEVGEENPMTVLVPPGVVHGYKCISDKGALCINLPDRLYKGGGKKEEVDEIRWEQDPESPYKIS